MNLPRGTILPILSILLIASILSALADEVSVQVKIADPFINLHTGPGKGYPVFYVIDRGELVSIEKRRTNWFRIRAENGRSGWASRDEMQLTLLPGGEQLYIKDADGDEFIHRDWSYGITAGEFENAPIISLFSAYSFSENLAIELSLSQSSADLSSSSLIKAGLMMQPYPQWNVSPYFTLGVGRINVKSGASLISANRHQSSFTQVGVGLHYYLSRRFVLKCELNEYLILSATNANDENEEIGEWKIGFSVFF
ncbi:MAG: SH3 domain-containing protein [Gammaproteobacteria bacterium]|nr:SH3 domain-containing protein [Gammaproteobacteria bacterium]